VTHSWLAAGIFIITYGLIIRERMHRTIAALLGGAAMIVVGILPQAQAFAAIDWNVIFLLVGMMIIANLVRETGLFQWIAVQAVRLGRNDPFRILVILSVVTAVSSAFLDNVTIVILVAPVTFFVAASLGISPMPFLIAEILASNIGGAATLIGDPPNILIVSAASIDFLTFAANMGPITVLILAVFLVMCWFLFGRNIGEAAKASTDIQALQAGALITDGRLLTKSLIVIGGVLLGLLGHAAMHLEPATIALTGATILLLWNGRDPRPALQDVEWTTLLFFVGLFITVEAVVEVGIIEMIADAAVHLTRGDLSLTSMLLLWFSAIASGIVDNIPYTATMIPVVESLGHTLPVEPLWWSLALGACLGGNTTLVGASANVVVADLAARSGHPIRFGEFLRYGLATALMSLLLSTAYIWLRYLLPLR
jgi:Na+/H+ antiporter NhaD/arsenite permease-like protein